MSNDQAIAPAQVPAVPARKRAALARLRGAGARPRWRLVDVRGVWLVLEMGKATPPGGLLDPGEGAMSNELVDAGEWCRYCREHRTESGMQCPVCADEMTRQHKAWLEDHRLRDDIIGFQKFIRDQQNDCRGQE